MSFEEYWNPILIIRPHSIVRQLVYLEPFRFHFFALGRFPFESRSSEHVNLHNVRLAFKFEMDDPDSLQRIAHQAALLFQLPFGSLFDAFAGIDFPAKTGQTTNAETSLLPAEQESRLVSHHRQRHRLGHACGSVGIRRRAGICLEGVFTFREEGVDWTLPSCRCCVRWPLGVANRALLMRGASVSVSFRFNFM